MLRDRLKKIAIITSTLMIIDTAATFAYDDQVDILAEEAAEAVAIENDGGQIELIRDSDHTDPEPGTDPWEPDQTGNVWDILPAGCDVYTGPMEEDTDADVAAKDDDNSKAGFIPPYPLPKLSGDWREDLIRVAGSQIGYPEADDGSSYYGDWLGQTYKPWCSEFASWCAFAAGISSNVIKPGRSSADFVRFFAPLGRYYYVKGGIDGSKTKMMKKNGFTDIKTIEPDDIEPGDIILYESGADIDDGPDHTAIFMGMMGKKTIDISGNSANMVRITMRNLSEVHGVCKPDFSKMKKKKDISGASVSLSFSKSAYKGKSQRPKVKIRYKGKKLKENIDYQITWFESDSVNAGNYRLRITGTGRFTGYVNRSYTIRKAKNSLDIRPGRIHAEEGSLRKKEQIHDISEALEFKDKGKGNISYKKLKGNKMIRVDGISGQILLEKGLGKGDYPLKVGVKASGNENYKACSKTVTILIKVR